MKKIAFVLFFLLTFSLTATTISFVEKKYNALAIGQITLSYRLISLSAGLVIAKATNPTDIVSLLENVDATLTNTQSFLSAEKAKEHTFTRRTKTLITNLLTCSHFVKTYATKKDLSSLNGMNNCIETLEKEILTLSDDFNKLDKKTKK
ncbi:hypothetical protein KAH37_06825 [bacterium]|nr:hypothetical protein [bacterium]